MDELQELCLRLLRDCNAISIRLLDSQEQELAGAGAVERLVAPSLASLFAYAAVLERLSTDQECSGQFREGERTHLHVARVKDAILIVLFDTRSSLGLVRLRVRKAAEELSRIFERGPGGPPPAAAAQLGSRRS